MTRYEKLTEVWRGNKASPATIPTSTTSAAPHWELSWLAAAHTHTHIILWALRLITGQLRKDHTYFTVSGVTHEYVQICVCMSQWNYRSYHALVPCRALRLLWFIGYRTCKTLHTDVHIQFALLIRRISFQWAWSLRLIICMSMHMYKPAQLQL